MAMFIQLVVLKQLRAMKMKQGEESGDDECDLKNKFGGLDRLRRRIRRNPRGVRVRYRNFVRAQLGAQSRRACRRRGGRGHHETSSVDAAGNRIDAVTTRLGNQHEPDD